MSQKRDLLTDYHKVLELLCATKKFSENIYVNIKLYYNNNICQEEKYGPICFDAIKGKWYFFRWKDRNFRSKYLLMTPVFLLVWRLIILDTKYTPQTMEQSPVY